MQQPRRALKKIKKSHKYVVCVDTSEDMFFSFREFIQCYYFLTSGELSCMCVMMMIMMIVDIIKCNKNEENNNNKKNVQLKYNN